MKILLYTNILTPYRKYFFDCLYERCVSEGHTFQVAVMAETEANRSWCYDQLQESYTHLLKSRTIGYKEIYVHFNPDLKQYLNEFCPDVIICAGGYLCPGISKICNLKNKLGYKVLFWSESHLGEARDYSSLKIRLREAIRKNIYKKFDGFFYAGKLSLEFIEKYSNINSKKFLMPNLVNEKKYNSSLQFDADRKKQIKEKYNLSSNKRLFICPARLSPAKGILEFLDIFKTCKYKDSATILIAGDGNLETKIRESAIRNNIDVKLLGYKNQDEIVELYAVSDVFLMPSLSDPNPLTSVEALWSGLPLMVSKHVGNYPESVDEGVNGYVFDYSSPQESAEKMDKIITSSEEWFALARKKSLEIAEETYNSKIIIDKVLLFLKDVADT